MARILVLGLAAMVVALPIHAAEMRYEIHWGGFNAAEAHLTRHAGQSALRVRATGLAEKLTDFTLEADCAGQVFRSHSLSRRVESLLAVDFAGPPTILHDEIRRFDRSGDDEPRPPVPEALKAGTSDPLTALADGAARITTGRPGESFTLAVFDGRNRFDVRVNVVGPATDGVLSGIKASAEVIPLAGFRPKSRETWDHATFTLLVDPATALPLRIASDNFTIATVVIAVDPMRRAGG